MKRVWILIRTYFLGRYSAVDFAFFGSITRIMTDLFMLFWSICNLLLTMVIWWLLPFSGAVQRPYMFIFNSSGLFQDSLVSRTYCFILVC